MFISKSRKGLKPRVPPRRGEQAPAIASQSSEPTAFSKTAQEPIQNGEERRANLPLEHGEPTLSKAAAITRRARLRNTSHQSPATQIAMNETPVVNGSERSQRSLRKATSVAQAQSQEDSEASVFKILSSGLNDTRPTATMPERLGPSSPPDTQRAAGGYIKKSKKAIQPKAPARRHGAVATRSAPSSDLTVASTGNTSSGRAADSVAEPARADDVDERLQAALASHGFQQSSIATNSILDPPVAPNTSKPGNVRGRRGFPSRAPAAQPSASVENAAENPVIAGASKKRKQRSANVADEDEEIQPPKKPKTTVTKSRSAKHRASFIVNASEEPPVGLNSDHKGATIRRSRQRKRKSAATVDEMADYQIATNEVRMGELVVDAYQGQGSTREKRLQERDVELKARRPREAQAKAREDLQRFMEDPEGHIVEADESQSAEQPSQNALGQSLATTPQESSTPDVTAAAPRFRIVAGQIVADESSRIIDRRAERARAVEANDDGASIVEEDDLSRRVNSRSFTKYDRPTRWDSASTALFHQGLQYFGLEFSMMACLFPGRSRRQLKAKYIREERADEAFVNSLLRDRKPIPSREELEKLMGKKLKEPRELDEELRMQKVRLEEAQRVEDEMLEQRRKEREREAEEQGNKVADHDGNDGNDDDDAFAAQQDDDETDDEAGAEVGEHGDADGESASEDEDGHEAEQGDAEILDE